VSFAHTPNDLTSNNLRQMRGASKPRHCGNYGHTPTTTE
jgi:hypothetical protein